MTNHERVRLFNCVKAWAGTAERLQGILGTCRAEQQAEHLRLVEPPKQHQAPARKERAA